MARHALRPRHLPCISRILGHHLPTPPSAGHRAREEAMFRTKLLSRRTLLSARINLRDRRGHPDQVRMSAKHGARNARIVTSRRNRIDELNAREDILQLATVAACCKDLLQLHLQPRGLKQQAIATG